MKTSVVAALQTMCLNQALMGSSDHFSFPLVFSFHTAGLVFASNKNTYFLPSQLIISSNPTGLSVQHPRSRAGTVATSLMGAIDTNTQG